MDLPIWSQSSTGYKSQPDHSLTGWRRWGDLFNPWASISSSVKDVPFVMPKYNIRCILGAHWPVSIGKGTPHGETSSRGSVNSELSFREIAVTALKLWRKTAVCSCLLLSWNTFIQAVRCLCELTHPSPLWSPWDWVFQEKRQPFCLEIWVFSPNRWASSLPGVFKQCAVSC